MSDKTKTTFIFLLIVFYCSSIIVDISRQVNETEKEEKQTKIGLAFLVLSG